ncbi:GGDEF domain-containing protein [Marinobacter sp. KMM 10035]|uniref:GGDEF domain-containing protein n=1 Tax=Marinobacter sp. KMM 10035 TaxID=3134034 RepID=UPI00397DA7F5
MTEEAGHLALFLVAPGTLGVFGVAFLWAWTLERKRHYLLLLASGCFSFSLGVLAQILCRPADSGLNAIISNVFYIYAVLAVAEGILLHSGKRFGSLNAVLVFGMFSFLIWYFIYVDWNLTMRIYIQNFGVGLIFFVTALRVTKLSRGRMIDKALFWTLVVFAVQFFPRTIMTVEASFPGTPELFGETLFWRTLQLSLAVLGAALAFIILAAAITDVIEELQEERDLDRLTGILNRRGFEERADRYIAKTHGPMAMILCDLDHFKRINDSFGHAAGDDVLCTFGSLMRRTVRGGDIMGRIGGEEFAILLRDSDSLAAHEFVLRLQVAIAKATFPLPEGTGRVTASMGVAVSIGGEARAHLLERADIALYKAKNAGRNRAVFCQGKQPFLTASCGSPKSF